MTATRVRVSDQIITLLNHGPATSETLSRRVAAYHSAVVMLLRDMVESGTIRAHRCSDGTVVYQCANRKPKEA